MTVFKDPFFIVGCVRSGTTMLRNILRLHPLLVSPEETHFFRWAWPFHTVDYIKTYLNNPTLTKHREIDQITEEEFLQILDSSISRGDLTNRYMKLFASKNKPEARCWYDKTPQNVYGVPMMMAEFPAAKFVHIVRNPVDVVSSLRIGSVLKVEDLVGAANYWREAVGTMSVMKKAYPEKIIELRYEDFASDSQKGLGGLLSFLNIPYEETMFMNFKIRQVSHRDEGLLSPEEIDRIREICDPWMSDFKYGE